MGAVAIPVLTAVGSSLAGKLVGSLLGGDVPSPPSAPSAGTDAEEVKQAEADRLRALKRRRNVADDAKLTNLEESTPVGKTRVGEGYVTTD